MSRNFSEITIWFDMDGTLVNFYGVKEWLPCLRRFDPTPYKIAKPLYDMRVVAKQLNAIQKKGYRIGIVSWLSKVSNKKFDIDVIEAKKEWLNYHLKSVHWDEICIIPYGQDKSLSCNAGIDDILFDDEKKNREAWDGNSFSPEEINKILAELNKG